MSVKFEVQYRLHQLTELTGLEFAPMLRNVASQNYTGDVTIVPSVVAVDYLGIISNPTPESLLRASMIGQRATWEKLAVTKIRCDVEFALDRLFLETRRKLIFESHKHNDIMLYQQQLQAKLLKPTSSSSSNKIYNNNNFDSNNSNNDYNKRYIYIYIFGDKKEINIKVFFQIFKSN